MLIKHNLFLIKHNLFRKQTQSPLQSHNLFEGLEKSSSTKSSSTSHSQSVLLSQSMTSITGHKCVHMQVQKCDNTKFPELSRTTLLFSLQTCLSTFHVKLLQKWDLYYHNFFCTTNWAIWTHPHS